MIEVIRIDNGTKRLLIVANTEEEKDWLKTFGTNVTIQLITENQQLLGAPVTGSLLLTMKKEESKPVQIT